MAFILSALGSSPISMSISLLVLVSGFSLQEIWPEIVNTPYLTFVQYVENGPN